MGSCNTSIIKDPQILPAASSLSSPSKSMSTSNSSILAPLSSSIASPISCFLNYNYSPSPQVSKGRISRGVNPTQFNVISVLGEGGFGKVYGTFCKHDGENYAVKVINKVNRIAIFTFFYFFLIIFFSI